MKLFTPSLLDSYTGGVREHEFSAGNVGEALDALEKEHPGVRFRVVDEQGQIRRHINLFVDGRMVRKLDVVLKETSEVHVFGALSGG